MMGGPIEGPANVFCDNEAVVKNSAFPESTVKKKHNLIAYHQTLLVLFVWPGNQVIRIEQIYS
jgi:hypothetical protein